MVRVATGNQELLEGWENGVEYYRLDQHRVLFRLVRAFEDSEINENNRILMFKSPEYHIFSAWETLSNGISIPEFYAKSGLKLVDVV